MRTLIVRLDHLGDLLQTTPLIRAVALAGHTVDVVVRQACAPVFDNSPYVRQCFGVETVEPNFPRAWWSLARWMRTRRYDIIILAYAKERRLCFASAFSGAPRRIAMWGGIWGRLTCHQCLRSGILTHPRPFAEILLQCATALGFPTQGLKPDLFLTETECAKLRSRIPASFRGHDIIGIHPGCAGNTCNLPSDVYAEVVRLLLERTDCTIIITGTEAERRLIRDWPLSIVSSERVWSSFGELTLRQLACAIKEMDVYVCPSTGPLHIASAVETSTVSPFCPTMPLSASIWGNVGAPSRVIEPPDCPRRSGTQQCCDFRGQISAEQVFLETIGLLKALGTVSRNSVT